MLRSLRFIPLKGCSLEGETYIGYTAVASCILLRSWQWWLSKNSEGMPLAIKSLRGWMGTVCPPRPYLGRETPSGTLEGTRGRGSAWWMADSMGHGLRVLLEWDSLEGWMGHSWRRRGTGVAQLLNMWPNLHIILRLLPQQRGKVQSKGQMLSRKWAFSRLTAG